MSAVPIDGLLTTAELAARWNCHPGSLVRDRSRGSLPIPYLKIGERVRYRMSDVFAVESARVVYR